METCINRRTDGRMVIATYWLTLRLDEDADPDKLNTKSFQFINDLI